MAKLAGVAPALLDRVERLLPIDGPGVKPSDLQKHIRWSAPPTMVRKAIMDLCTLGRARFEGPDGFRRYWRVAAAPEQGDQAHVQETV